MASRDDPADLSDLEKYHIRLVEEGIRQADAGDLVDHEDVVGMVPGTRRAKDNR